MHRTHRNARAQPGQRFGDGPGGVNARFDIRSHCGETGKESGLHGGLVGPGAVQFRGPVRRKDHQRDAGVVGLHHGGHQFADGGARRRHHGGGAASAPGQAKGGKPGHPLVDADMDPDPVLEFRLRQRVGQGCAARPRGQDDVADPGGGQGTDGGAGRLQ